VHRSADRGQLRSGEPRAASRLYEPSPPAFREANSKRYCLAPWPPPLLRRHAHRLAVRIGRILVDAALDLGPEMRDQPLDRPGRRVAERADRMALDQLGDVEQHVDLALLRPALRHAGHHPPHPASALAARRTLAAAL